MRALDLFSSTATLHTDLRICNGHHPASSLLDRRGRRFRVDRAVAFARQQHHPAGVPRSSRHQRKKALIAFGKPGWQRRLERAIRQWWFELTLPRKIDAAEKEWLAAQPLTPKPVVVNEPPNDELQTAKSRLLGGAMTIHSPWSDAQQQDPPD